MIGPIEYHGYPYIQDDGGRAASRRPQQKGDCTVRALAIVLDIEYDRVYDVLKMYGRKCFEGFAVREFLDKYTLFGYRFEWRPFNAVKGQRRMNPVTFCQMYAEGRYIAYTAKHVTAVIDGIWHDTFVSGGDRCIYAVHRVTNWQKPITSSQNSSAKPQCSPSTVSSGHTYG